MKYYEPRHFEPYEYVPPEIYDELGDNSILLIDDRVLRTDDAIRAHFGVRVLINTWHWGGTHKFSGWRPANCPEGSRWSQHKWGRASDKRLVGIDAETARHEILKNPKTFPHIRAMEDGVAWLHTDCRPALPTGIYLFKP